MHRCESITSTSGFGLPTIHSWHLFVRKTFDQTHRLNIIRTVIMLGPMSVQFLNWRYAVMMRSDAMAGFLCSPEGGGVDGTCSDSMVPADGHGITNDGAYVSAKMPSQHPSRENSSWHHFRLIHLFRIHMSPASAAAALLHLQRSASDGLPMPRCPLNRSRIGVVPVCGHVGRPAGRCRLAPSRSGLHRLIHSMARACGWGGRRRGVHLRRG